MEKFTNCGTEAQCLKKRIRLDVLREKVVSFVSNNTKRLEII